MSRLIPRAVVMFGVLALVATVGCAQGSIEDEDTGLRQRADTEPPPVDTTGGMDTAVDRTDTMTGDSGADDAVDGADGADGTDDLDADAASDTGSGTEDSTDGGSDTGDPEDTDDGGDDGGEVGPCNGLCGPKEVCENGVCVDACARENADCGTVTASGDEIDCGSCGNNKFCKSQQCRDICSAAGADCGEVFWGGATAQCGSCGGSKICTNNECASTGYHSTTGGYRHTCATRDNGNAACWGQDSNNELGNGSDSSSLTPIAVDTTSSLSKVRGLNTATCAITQGGGGECWGLNYRGQLGDGTSDSRSSPVAVQNLSQAVDISAGNLHSCAVLSTGDIKCWGDQTSGRLGNGDTSPAIESTPVDVKTIDDGVQVAAGGSHTCALRADGSVWCWGNAHYGVLGDGSFQNGSSTPKEVDKIDPVVDLSAGVDHNCAVTVSGEVWCWGNGGDYQLGNQSQSNKAVPVQARGLTEAVEVAAGKAHTCALDKAGEVWCWGKNSYTDGNGTVTTGGQLGNGTTVEADKPVNVVGAKNSGNSSLVDVMTIGVGYRHSCAIKTSGTVFCWGDNTEGQLGVGASPDFSDEPMEVQ